MREVGDDLNFNIKDDYNPKRPKPVILRELPYEERAKFIAENPDTEPLFVDVETVSKVRTLDAIRRPIPVIIPTLMQSNEEFVQEWDDARGGFCASKSCGVFSARN
ncbi:MAG: hypothetical protein ACLTS6_10795 [Anaerobutyricum sp.]